jgi:glycosyltransferase involved in cell wall biosynthesis
MRGDFFREARDRLCNRSGRLAWAHYLLEIGIARLCLRRAAALLFNSRYLFAAFDSEAPGRPRSVVYNPYTPLAPSKAGNRTLPRSKLRLLTVTNLNLWSKASPLLEMLDDPLIRAALEAEDACWVVCGGGTLETKFRAELSRRGIAHRVLAVGGVENIVEYYEWSDVLVHLTRMDSFPNVTLEAMACSRPVIINADSCGTAEQVAHGLNGFIVASAKEFREAVLKYAADPILRTAHGQQGRLIVERYFSVTAQTPFLQSFVTAVMSGSAVRSRLPPIPGDP